MPFCVHAHLCRRCSRFFFCNIPVEAMAPPFCCFLLALGYQIRQKVKFKLGRVFIFCASGPKRCPGGRSSGKSEPAGEIHTAAGRSEAENPPRTRAGGRAVRASNRYLLPTVRRTPFRRVGDWSGWVWGIRHRRRLKSG